MPPKGSKLELGVNLTIKDQKIRKETVKDVCSMSPGVLFRHPPSCPGARVVMTRNTVELRQLSKLYTIVIRLMETQ